MLMHVCIRTRILLISSTIISFLSRNILCNLHGGIGVVAFESFGELPVKDDFDKYVGSLEKIVEFSTRYKHHVDQNFEFGLFLINAHIKPILKRKRTKLTVRTFRRLGKILYENEKLTDYFHYMVRNMPDHVQRLHEDVARITSLYSNETYWVERMPPLTLDLMKHTKRRTETQLKAMYSIPDAYQQRVFNFDKGVPTPQLSDKCMSYLADNSPFEGKKRPPKCFLPDACKRMLKETTGLGYFICHRLLHFIAAHMGRGCVLLSEHEDKLAMREMCTMISDESRYIAMTNFTIKDLLLEEVALCSLSGHAQFLQRGWIQEILRFQTKLGCFGNEITSVWYPKEAIVAKWTVAKADSDILGGYCNVHLTAVAAATLAASVRYILEHFY